MDELTTAAGEERTAGEEPGADAPETPGASGVAPEREHRSATVEYPAEVVDPLAPVKPVINYHISDFDGPLDLLVELIGKARIAIEDIFVSDVTRQYVEIVAATPREELDYEYASEFITLAAQLVLIKSKSALPADEEDDYFDDVEVQKRDLINKIKAYALIKEEAEKLRETETINRFYRMPDFTEKDYRVALTGFSLPKLVEAFARVLVNMDRKEVAAIPKKVVQDRFSVSDQMQNIHMVVVKEGGVKFTSLIEPDYTRSDIVTTFLAVLELLKYGRLRVEQEELFGEIMLYAAEGDDGAPLDLEDEEFGKY